MAAEEKTEMECVSGGERVNLGENPERLVGRYVLMWRNKRQEVTRVIEHFEEGGKKKFMYEMVSGQDKGRKFKCEYDGSQTIEVFDDSNVILAMMGGDR